MCITTTRQYNIIIIINRQLVSSIATEAALSTSFSSGKISFMPCVNTKELCDEFFERCKILKYYI